MVHKAIDGAGALKSHCGRPARPARPWRRFAADRRGITTIDYALTMAGIVLGSTAATSLVGVEITTLFHEIEFSLCMQVQQLCIMH